MNKKLNASQNIANRLAWHTASRDQAGIAKELAEGKDIPEVYGLGEAGLFDEFFYFLDRFGFTSLLPGLNQKQKREIALYHLCASSLFEILWLTRRK